MHSRKELEAHQVEKGPSSCDSEAAQVGSAQSNSTRVVKVNRHKTNHHKMRPYVCLSVCMYVCVCVYNVYCQI